MKKHDWWRMNSRQNASGDIYYCLRQGIVKARVKNGRWIWKKVYDARDALAVGFEIINSEELKKQNEQ
jgi:hypothetical protein